MSRTLVSIEDVKHALNVDDLRKISKDKLMEFISLIPNMDKEVAIEIIRQFPSFADFGTTVVGQLRLLLEETVIANNESNSASIDAYQKILDDLSILLQKDYINEEESEWIVNKMILVADRIAVKDTENKNYLERIGKYGGSLAVGALVLGAAVLGVKSGNIEIPKIKG